MAKETVWLGETQCNFCKHEIEGNLYDAKTIYGCWATMCEDCYELNKKYDDLGVGKGQRYRMNPKTGKWIKIEG